MLQRLVRLEYKDLSESEKAYLEFNKKFLMDLKMRQDLE